jgi:hypothetical protein
MREGARERASRHAENSFACLKWSMVLFGNFGVSLLRAYTVLRRSKFEARCKDLSLARFADEIM